MFVHQQLRRVWPTYALTSTRIKAVFDWATCNDFCFSFNFLQCFVAVSSSIPMINNYSVSLSCCQDICTSQKWILVETYHPSILGSNCCLWVTSVPITMLMLVISVMLVDENEDENSEDEDGVAYPRNNLTHGCNAICLTWNISKQHTTHWTESPNTKRLVGCCIVLSIKLAYGWSFSIRYLDLINKFRNILRCNANLAIWM